MSSLQYYKPTQIRLKNHSGYDEIWLQGRIAEDPSILGLGDLELKDKERTQPKGGRLDILLSDPETGKRYEVEIQLGTVDESHIIRTIEYWDIERRRFPQYDHTAVIIAEEITSRFLNVIGLFNGFIPLVAIQLNALRVEDKLVLNFTKVLDELALGLEEEEEVSSPIANRLFWDQKTTDISMKIVDICFRIIRSISPAIEPNYTRSYIGTIIDGKRNNIASFHPKQKHIRIRVNRLENVSDWRERIEAAELTFLRSPNQRSVLLRVNLQDLEENESTLRDLFQAAYDNR